MICLIIGTILLVIVLFLYSAFKISSQVDNIGGVIINKRKKLKWNNRLWYIEVKLYQDKRVCLILKNKKESKEITIDLVDSYLDYGHIFLDPTSKDNGLLNVLKKSRIIKNISGINYYNYLSIPVAQLNMGILKKYDYKGISDVKEEIV